MGEVVCVCVRVCGCERELTMKFNPPMLAVMELVLLPL